MISQYHQNKVFCWMVILSSFALLLLLSLSWQVQAGPLPPRDPPPTFTPAPTVETRRDDNDRQPEGAYIEMEAGATTLWTVVQWQDDLGGWHDVEGWRGSLNQRGNKRWWVAPRDFNSGPFRWVIFSSPDGAVLAESPSFYLPKAAGEIIKTDVSLGD